MESRQVPASSSSATTFPVCVAAEQRSVPTVTPDLAANTAGPVCGEAGGLQTVPTQAEQSLGLLHGGHRGHLSHPTSYCLLFLTTEKRLTKISNEEIKSNKLSLSFLGDKFCFRLNLLKVTIKVRKFEASKLQLYWWRQSPSLICPVIQIPLACVLCYLWLVCCVICGVGVLSVVCAVLFVVLVCCLSCVLCCLSCVLCCLWCWCVVSIVLSFMFGW